MCVPSHCWLLPLPAPDLLKVLPVLELLYPLVLRFLFVVSRFPAEKDV